MSAYLYVCTRNTLLLLNVLKNLRRPEQPRKWFETLKNVHPLQVGTSSDIQQPASGMSHDWAKARAGIKFSYHVDLRDSFGPYGFLLPGSQIVSTAREIWQAIKTIVDNLSP